MKKLLALAPGIAAWVGLIIMSMPVFAQDATQNVPVDEVRIEQRLQSRQIFLDTATTQRIIAQCESVQIALDEYAQNASTVVNRRQQVYASTLQKLESLVAQLDAAQQVDTSDVSIQIRQLEALIAEFGILAETYTVALNDAAGISCTDNPAGFIAAVEDAREQIVELKSNSTDIREYISVAIGATIERIKTQLDATQEQAT